MPEKNNTKRSKYNSVRLLYYRTRLRLSNAFDWVKIRLGFSSSKSYDEDTDTDCSSTSYLQSYCYSESEGEKEIKCSDSELANSNIESHDNVILDSDSESNNCKEWSSRNARKKFIRQRRSSRTRSMHSDDHYDMETLNELKTTLRSGIGDQPDNYDSIDDDTEKSRSMAERHERKSKTITSEPKNNIEEMRSNVCLPDGSETDIKDSASSIEKVKTRKPLPLYEDAYVSPPLKIKNRHEQLKDMTDIKVDKPIDTKKTEKIVSGDKITLSNKKNTKVEAKTSYLASYISSLGKPRAKISKAPTAHMAFGVHFVRSDSVRKHTCGQEFRKLFGIPEQPKQTKLKQATLAPAGSKKTNNENASNSGENKTEILAVRENGADENRKFDYNLKAPMGTRIYDPPFVSYTSSYASNPKTYLCGHPNINEYKEVSTLQSHSPKSPFARQFD